MLSQPATVAAVIMDAAGKAHVAAGAGVQSGSGGSAGIHKQ
jgi:hypothetical protein